MRFAAITHVKPTFALKKWGWDSGKGGNSITNIDLKYWPYHFHKTALSIHDKPVMPKPLNDG
jgi:hypothetical protein